MRRKTTTKEPRYSGELATPIARSPGLLPDPPAEAQRIADAAFAKLPALGAAYGIDFDWSHKSTLALMLALALEHVPGFRTAAPPGRKKQLTPWELAELRLEVEGKMHATRKTQPQAVAMVKKTAKWRAKLQATSDAALVQQLKEGRRWLDMVEAAWEWQRLQGQAPKPDDL